MAICNCPKCEQQVGVPQQASPLSFVRCPLCQAEFSPAEVTLIDLPMLEPVDVDSHAAEIDLYPPNTEVAERDAPVAGKALDQAKASDDLSIETENVEELRLADPVDIAADNPFDFTLTEKSSSPATSNGTSLRAAGGSDKNLALEMFKIGAGGVAGIVIAIAILWWGAGKDPFNLSQKVPDNLSFLVPETIQFGSEDLGEKVFSPDDDKEHSSEFVGFDPSSDLADEPEGDSASFSSQLGKSSDGTFLKSDEPPLSEEADLPVLRVNNAPVYPASELDNAIVSVEKTLPLLEEVLDTSKKMDKKVRQQRALEFYAAQCRMADVITYIDNSSVGMLPRIQKITLISEQIAGDETKLSLLGNIAARQFHLSERDGPGILLVGVVKSVTAHGKNLHETRLTLFGKSGQEISILSWHDPSATYSANSKIVLFGSIIENPTANLPGYQGSESQIVFGGFPVILTK